jgi:preprotein translocase subunit YajC
VNGFGFLLILVALAFLWLVLIRPQRRRQVAVQQMLDALRVGDEVLTAGGIFGRVSRIDGEEVTLEIAPGTEVRVARRAIAGVTPEDEPAEPEQPDDDVEEAPGGPPGGEEGG